MNYYKRHIGDYIRDTSHLSLIEHGAYARLLDLYYSRESALPEKDVMRLLGCRNRAEQNAVKSVLQEFFHLTPDGWSHGRCDEEITASRNLSVEQGRKGRASAAKRSGSTGGQPEVNRTSTETQPNANRNSTEPIPSGSTETQPSHKPLAISHKPIAKVRGAHERWKSFEALKAEYPNGTYRGNAWILAERLWRRLLEDDSEAEEVLLGKVREYRLQLESLGRIGTQYVLSPAKFFADSNWRGPFPVPINGHSKPLKSADEIESEIIENCLRSGKSDEEIWAQLGDTAPRDSIQKVRERLSAEH